MFIKLELEDFCMNYSENGLKNLEIMLKLGECSRSKKLSEVKEGLSQLRRNKFYRKDVVSLLLEAEFLNRVGESEEKIEFLEGLEQKIGLEIAYNLIQKKELMEINELFVADCASIVKDRNFLERLSRGREDISEVLLRFILNEEEEKLDEKFRKFCLKRKFKGELISHSAYLNELLNSAWNLRERYDFGLPIARGGLYAGFVFNLMGLSLVVARAKRRGNGTEFHWIDDPEKIRDKRVLVIEDDVAKGRTIRRVAEEIKVYQPKEVDLFLGDKKGFYKERINQIPTLFERVYFMDSFETSENNWGICQTLKRLGI